MEKKLCQLVEQASEKGMNIVTLTEISSSIQAA